MTTTTEEDEANVKAFVDDLVEEIKDGFYDSQIRRIARACFARREALGGPSGVSKPKGEIINDPPGPDDSSQSAPSSNDYMSVQPALAQTVAPRRRVQNGGAIRWNGNRYYTTYLNDGYVTLVNPSSRFHGWTVWIKDIDSAPGKSDVVFIAKPQNYTRSSSGFYGQTMTISRNLVIRSILGRPSSFDVIKVMLVPRSCSPEFRK